MPWPAGINLTTIGGSVLGPGGVPANGTVEFHPPMLRDAADHVLVGNKPIIGLLVNGVLNVQVPANDSPNVQPQGWAYQIIVCTDQARYEFQGVVPSSPSSTTLDRIVQVVDPTPPATFVPLTSVGQPNGVVPTDGNNRIPSQFLPAGSGVLTLAAADSTIVIGGSPANPTVAVGTVLKANLAAAVQTSLGLADTALQSAPVTSVAGHTGAVTLSKSDVGLSAVDNTSDANKPVSTAQAAAIAACVQNGDLAMALSRAVLPISFYSGAKAASYHPDQANQALNDGVSHGSVIALPGPWTYTMAGTILSGSGSRGAGTGQPNGIAIWSVDGNTLLAQTPDEPNIWTSAPGEVWRNLSSNIVVPAGITYVKAEVVVAHYDTAPTFPFLVQGDAVLQTVGGTNGPRAWYTTRTAIAAPIGSLQPAARYLGGPILLK